MQYSREYEGRDSTVLGENDSHLAPGGHGASPRVTLIRRVFGSIFSIRQDEAATAGLMFVYSFLAMTGYNVLRPITRSKFITALGADNLPYVLLIAGVLIAVLMQGYSRATSLIPRRWAIPSAQLAISAILLVFWFLFGSDAVWISVAFYVFG